MTHKYRDKGRIEGPFIPVLKETWQCAARRATTPSARLVYIALKARYSFKLRNNGRIYLSVREAAKELGLNKDTIARAFRELCHYGFIVIVSGSCLGVEGHGKAPHWRLTELGHMHDSPTRDFLRWDGTPFGELKDETLSEKIGHPVRKNRTPLSEKFGHLGAELSEKPGHTSGHACPKNSDISRLTTSPSEKDGTGAQQCEPAPWSAAVGWNANQKWRLKIQHMNDPPT
jgi:hypothetical protein